MMRWARLICKTVTAIVVCVLANGSTGGNATTLPEIAAHGRSSILRVRDFVDAIGMNCKFKDIGSLYADVPGALKQLQYLGVSLVREGFPARELSEQQLQGYHAFAAIGGRFTFVTHNEKPVPEIVADIAAFERAYPGAVRAVEGPNELNHWPISYNGLKGPAAAKTYMADLYAAVKGDAVLGPAGVRVYGVTDWPSTSTTADYANVHSYERNAFASHERLRQDRDEGRAAFASSVETPPGAKPPWVLTETGYHTWLEPGWFTGVDPATQARLGLMLIFGVAELGGEETQWYQLLDAWGPPKSGEEAFGVFDHNGKPKPLALALHNTTQILADRGPTARTFVTKPLLYDLAGNLGQPPHEGVYHLPLQRSDQSHFLAVWRENVVWDHLKKQARTVNPRVTRVNFAEPVARLEIYDPFESTSPIKVLTNVSGVDLPLANQLQILRIN